MLIFTVTFFPPLRIILRFICIACHLWKFTMLHRILKCLLKTHCPVFKDAGLDTMTGASAEILVDSVERNSALIKFLPANGWISSEKPMNLIFLQLQPSCMGVLKHGKTVLNIYSYLGTSRE